MNNSMINNLGRDKLQQLLGAIGSAAQQPDEQTAAPVYNWHEPHYFSREQLEKINSFTERFIGSISEKFAELCREKYDVSAASTSQHFASELCNQFSEKQTSDYCMPFGTNPEQPFGFLGIHEKSAVVWAKQLLGDSDAEEKPGRILSQLEESLLADVAVALVGTLKGLYPSGEIKPAKNMVKGYWPLDSRNTEELYRISLNIKKAGSQNVTQAYFIISCSKLDCISGKKGQNDTKTPAGDSYNMIFEHIGTLPVLVTAHLGWVDIGFEEMLNLQAGDIILLDKTVQEPVILAVNDHLLGYGRLARCVNQYAVAVTATKFPGAAANKNPGAGTTITKGKK
jgi:flagellar motor switch protein FliM